MPVIRVAAAVAVCLVALATRLLAVNVLPVDFDEDDYLPRRPAVRRRPAGGRSGRVPAGQLPVRAPAAREDRHGPGAGALPRFAEVPDRPTTADPATDLPEPQLTVARSAEAVFGAATASAGAGLARRRPLAGGAHLDHQVHEPGHARGRAGVLHPPGSAGGDPGRAPPATIPPGRAGARRPGWRSRPSRWASRAPASTCTASPASRSSADWLWQTRQDVRGTEGRFRPAALPRWLGPWPPGSRSRSSPSWSPRTRTSGRTRSGAWPRRSPTTAATRRAPPSRTPAGRRGSRWSG